MQPAPSLFARLKFKLRSRRRLHARARRSHVGRQQDSRAGVLPRDGGIAYFGSGNLGILNGPNPENQNQNRENHGDREFTPTVTSTLIFDHLFRVAFCRSSTRLAA